MENRDLDSGVAEPEWTSQREQPAACCVTLWCHSPLSLLLGAVRITQYSPVLLFAAGINDLGKI